MPAARHFFKPGTLSNDELKADITDDIATARGAQQSLQQAGHNGRAEQMRQATDEHLDELNDLNNGTWTPRYGS
ncbi:hypothetical protein [Streptomyces sp. NBC_00271]|uniref:hypothetical protein n=1 Tax=Streptomyces sp. NBC_00271 TaxID=2975697 RepID=UPI002E29A9F3|nr:hypothetical protein [Streptomyces sp. NBC_00271]